jgi:hypothetical protein
VYHVSAVHKNPAFVHRRWRMHKGRVFVYELVVAADHPEWIGQTFILKIIKKQKINGKNYFLFDSDFPQGICSLDSGLFRVEGQLEG